MKTEKKDRTLAECLEFLERFRQPKGTGSGRETEKKKKEKNQPYVGHDVLPGTTRKKTQSGGLGG